LDRGGAEPLTIDRLERWALFGAHWRVVDLSSDRAVVELCACTGELVESAELVKGRKLTVSGTVVPIV
jgi:hypothetical protein